MQSATIPAGRTGRKVWLAVLHFAVLHFAYSQPAYFQQEVHYQIEASLNDSTHTLHSRMRMRYVNHSPDTLREIWFHLWPNAYSRKYTAFDRQALRMRNARFHFAAESELGGLSGLDFQVDGASANLIVDEQNLDMALLLLPKPLHPGGSIQVETPFVLRIPESFSRLGRAGQSYQLTQWYPKPAVYDRKGWHPMPYLDMGEFYSEFGSFDVSLTLPENYIVAATGELQTETERAFWEEKVGESEASLAKWPDKTQAAPFPASANRMKTIRFTADRVHDFAWFADKRFMVQHREVALPSGRKVDAWAFFTPYQAHWWKQGAEYVAQALQFYSAAVGEYPWPQATAVEGALSAGGGMEYPMITIIGGAGSAKALDEVIAHEVGHNWFYGILASNERDHAWMDEGLNSYYEKRYIQTRYGPGTGLEVLPKILQGTSKQNLDEIAYLLQARRRMDQAPETGSDDFGALNYFLGAYSKPAVALGFLEQYLGVEALDRAMQAYYREWQFRHPYPDDFQAAMERETGRNLDWFFEGLTYSNKPLDYSLLKSRLTGDTRRVFVKNSGRIPAPLQVSAMRGDSVLFSRWFEGFQGVQALDIPSGNYDRIAIDPDRLAPEVNRRNNYLRTSGVLRRVEPLQIRLLPQPEDDTRSTIFATPFVAGNTYDKLMPGVALYNSTLPERPLEWVLAPMYATGTKSLAGAGQLHWHLYPAGKFIHGVHVGLQGRLFHFQRNEDLDYVLQYARLMPFVRLELAKPAASTLHQMLQWRVIGLRREHPAFSREGDFKGIDAKRMIIQEWSYHAEQRRVVNPHSLLLALERQKTADFPVDANYWKASVEWKTAFTYERGRHIHLRCFAGGFLSNSRRNRGAIFPEAFNLTAQGFNDYRFDDFYFGRTEAQGVWSQQISLREGGMKALTGQGFAMGRSNNFIVAVNLSADLPRRFLLPLKPYFDIGYFDNAMPTGANDTFADQLIWSGGVSLELFDGIFGVYLPLINSSNLAGQLAGRGRYFRRIAFALDLNRLNPYELAKRAVY